ncbi:protein phosphatase 1E [Lucilia cuprina]|uniref:protein phosphatase 1E n=1 Tax=Lucilia cuprina TaxID=7375 RepID=UPI001F06BD78|nr:protein phosphatase 1E [Lucilia cuprina]
MASTLSEKIESKNDMTHTNSCCSNVAEKQCNHLKYFKEFLRDLTKDAVTNEGGGGDVVGSEGVNVSCNGGGSGGVELRPFILTRSNNESYAVAKDELSAEVIMCIWQWLVEKKCPEHFQVGVARFAEEEINKELKNKKLQEDLKATGGKQVEDTSDPAALDLLKLQKYIQQQLDKVLLRLCDNSKEDNLKNYADCSRETLYKCSESASSSHTPYVEAHVKNKPRKMEDRHICLPQFSNIYRLEKSLSFYGVFDGHSGSLAATYAINQIPYRVAQQLNTMHNSSTLDSDCYRDALETSFLQADHNFCQKQLSSGTTAVCALLLKDGDENFKHLYVAWVGDSRCLLVSPTVHLQLVKPHKPDSADEKKRIESTETGGSVIFVQGQWRVNGIINVSRSIGDYTVKAVIAEPDIVDVPLQPSHDFLLLGSDGLWDHVNEKEIVDCVYKSLADNEQCLEDIPKHLIELAKKGDSQDNITVVLVLLKERQKIKEHFTKSLNKSS